MPAFLMPGHSALSIDNHSQRSSHRRLNTVLKRPAGRPDVAWGKGSGLSSYVTGKMRKGLTLLILTVVV
jgi:hypothetical protein